MGGRTSSTLSSICRARALTTLQLGLLAFFSHYYVNWPGYMAGSVLVLIPVLILFAATQRTFIEGITFQGLKG